MSEQLTPDDKNSSANPVDLCNAAYENKHSSRTILSTWHNEIIALTAIGSLIVTGVLAIITYSSLKEVKSQRELTYKQFVMANRPNVNIGFERSGLRLNDKIGYIDWQIGNKGGDVEDLIYQCVLFHMKGKGKSDFSIEEFYVRNIKQKHLNNDTKKSIHNQIEDAHTLKKINDILAMDKRFNILGLFIRIEYTIPAELTLDGKPRKDSRYQIFAWDVIDKRFEDVKVSYFNDITEKISSRNLFSLKEQG